MSRCLKACGIEHVVLERGRIGERWRVGSWDSLRLLTPNWMTRLPGWSYCGPDRDGFMKAAELPPFLETYAASFEAPIEMHTTVHSVRNAGGGYRVETSRGTWQAQALVIAAGECQQPLVPPMADRLTPEIRQITGASYKRPKDLPIGRVLVVGASASGIQLAQEIHRSGRPVILSVGPHTRLTRRYRGRDIMAWMDAAGILDERAETVADIDMARRQPSLQLVGSPEGRTIDLHALREQGVRIMGRVTEIQGGSVGFSDDLAETTAAADRRLARLLGRIDALINTGVAGRLPPPDLPASGILHSPRTTIDLVSSGVRTVVWATGYVRRYPWLNVPVLDRYGEIIHDGGVTPAAGLYVLGLRFLRRRKSNFIDGVGRDAEEIATRVAKYLRAAHSVAA